jgi:tungstate transport system substrate-binding protein
MLARFPFGHAILAPVLALTLGAAQAQGTMKLKLLFRGGEILANPYHTLYLADPTAGAATARQFGDYLASDKVQALLREFGKDRYGEPMYNDAAATARIVGD